MKKRKTYSDEFKAEAVAMVVDQDRPISEVCDALAIGSTALRRWVQVHQTHHNGSTVTEKTVLSAEQAQIKILEKQVKQLQRERDVLKKSIAFFAREIAFDYPIHISWNQYLSKF